MRFGKFQHRLELKIIWLFFAAKAKTKEGHYYLLQIYKQAKAFGQFPIDVIQSPIQNPHVRLAFNTLVFNIGEEWEKKKEKDELELRVQLSRMSAGLPPKAGVRRR